MEIISEFTNNNIDNWEIKIKKIISYDRKILYFNNGHWRMNNRREKFFQYADRFLDSDLNKLETIAIKILKEINPMFELESDDRYAAALYGKIPRYSSDIKKSITEILALLSVNEEKLKSCSDFKVSNIVNEIIDKVFEDATWQLWASLNEYLPIIAEISPDKFLEVAKEALSINPCPFDEIFIQGGQGITGWNYMTGFYWALETLAWDENYIARSLLILAELATHDPGGKWVNTPLNSIVTILLPWFPQTLVSSEKRLGLINILKKNFPDIAFNVILYFLPKQFQTSHGTHKPFFRNPIAPDWQPEKNDIDYYNHCSELAKIAIEMIKTNKEYLIKLLEHIENIPYEQLLEMLSYLETNEIINLSDKEKYKIWEKLNFTVNKHRKFSNSHWAFDKELIDKIQDTSNKIKPNNPKYIYRYLFSKDDHFYFDDKTKWENYIKEIEDARSFALERILEYGGIDDIFDFAFSVDDRYKVGYSLFVLENIVIQNIILPEYLDSMDIVKNQLVNGFIIGNYSNKGEAWLDAIDFSTWSKDKICSLLLNIAYSEKIWDKALKMLGDNVNIFWEKFSQSPYALNGNLVIAIDNLIKYGRPLYAAEVIYIHYYREKELLLDKAEKAFISGISNNKDINRVDKHSLMELLKLLQANNDIDQNKLFKIEWAYFSLFDSSYGEKPITLEKCLSSDPSFFLQLLKILYCSENNTEDDRINNEKPQTLISTAYYLLENWRLIPGFNDNNVINDSILTEWFYSVKKISMESGYLGMAMFHIGKLFYYAPKDITGFWINKKIAEFLDEKDNNDIRRGYLNKAIYSRGAHIVDKTGSEEKRISEFWMNRSKELESESFVYFAITAKEISVYYEQDAKMNISRFSNFNDNKEIEVV